MGKAAKKTTTNAKTTMKGTGIDKEKERPGKIWVRKATEEEQENLRKARDEEAGRLRKEQENFRKAREEEAARLREKQERWARRSKFGNLMFLVIEFPKGGDLWFHKYSKFLRSVTLAPPCLIKGVYAKRDECKRDRDIGNKMKMIYLGIDKTSFVPLDKYDERLREFLEFLMANMGEPSEYAEKEDIEWFIAFYWRMQWLKHGLCHDIAEMDYYWKIYDLYQKAYIGHYLYRWWRRKAGYYERRDTDEIMVMACKGSTLSNGIFKLTAHRSLILSNPYTIGLRQIYIGFDGGENFVDIPLDFGWKAFSFGPKGFWNSELFV